MLGLPSSRAHRKSARRVSPPGKVVRGLGLGRYLYDGVGIAVAAPWWSLDICIHRLTSITDEKPDSQHSSGLGLFVQIDVAAERVRTRTPSWWSDVESLVLSPRHLLWDLRFDKDRPAVAAGARGSGDDEWPPVSMPVAVARSVCRPAIEQPGCSLTPAAVDRQPHKMGLSPAGRRFGPSLRTSQR